MCRFSHICFEENYGEDDVSLDDLATNFRATTIPTADLELVDIRTSPVSSEKSPAY